MNAPTRNGSRPLGATCAISLPLILIAGCAGDPGTTAQAPAVSEHLAAGLHPAADPGEEAPAAPAPATQPMEEEPAPVAAPERPHEQVLYFATDESRTQPADLGLIQQHARYLAAHPGLILRLDGHADARGPEPYNRSLSERRAAEVQKLLVDHGAPAERILIEGRGANEPAAEEWAENRRVEFEYTEGFALTRN